VNIQVFIAFDSSRSDLSGPSKSLHEILEVPRVVSTCFKGAYDKFQYMVLNGAPENGYNKLCPAKKLKIRLLYCIVCHGSRKVIFLVFYMDWS
jgi:hypothetical protein